MKLLLSFVVGCVLVALASGGLNAVAQMTEGTRTERGQEVQRTDLPRGAVQVDLSDVPADRRRKIVEQYSLEQFPRRHRDPQSDPLDVVFAPAQVVHSIADESFGTLLKEPHGYVDPGRSRPKVNYFFELSPRSQYWDEEFSMPQAVMLAHVVGGINRSPQSIERIYALVGPSIERFVPPDVYVTSGAARTVMALLNMHDELTKLPDVDRQLERLHRLSQARETAGWRERDEAKTRLYAPFWADPQGKRDAYLEISRFWLASFWVRRQHEGNRKEVHYVLQRIAKRYKKRLGSRVGTYNSFRLVDLAGQLQRSAEQDHLYSMEPNGKGRGLSQEPYAPRAVSQAPDEDDSARLYPGQAAHEVKLKAKIKTGTADILASPEDIPTIKKVMKHYNGRVKSCYERQLKGNPALAGKVTVSFEIQTDGKVAAAAIEDNTTGSKDLENCIIKVIRSIRISPSPPDYVEVRSYPYIFSAQSE